MEIQTIQENTDMYIEELIELCYINTMGKLIYDNIRYDIKQYL